MRHTLAALALGQTFPNRSQHLQLIQNVRKRRRFGHPLDGFENQLPVAHGEKLRRSVLVCKG